MSRLSRFFKNFSPKKNDKTDSDETAVPPSGKLVDILSPDHIVMLSPPAKKSELLKSLVKKICELDSELQLEPSYQAIMEREKLRSSYMKHGVSFPHARLEKIKRIHAILGIYQNGFPVNHYDPHNQSEEFQNDNEQEETQIHFVFLFLSPSFALTTHLQFLSKASWLFQNKDLRQKLLSSTSGASALSTLIEFERNVPNVPQ